MKKTQKIMIPGLSALLTFTVFALVCRRLGVIPFSRGAENTLAWADAFYQYLDFFGWYKEILAGRESVWYTFTSSLGQNAIGLFTYYLSSPFNLLLAFFTKTQLQYFFNITAGLKMAAASCCMAVYLQERFNRIRPGFTLALSLCYGLAQYGFSQSSNLMWMDGVYMLPLILLGVYRLVDRKDIFLPGAAVGLSVLFNWYTGGINCLAACMYFPVELCLKKGVSGSGMKKPGSGLLYDVFRFMAAMLAGLALSAVLFIPTVLSMRTGRGSALDWDLIRSELMGSPVSLIRAYSPGEVSAEGYAALFCGSLPVLGCMGFFALRGRRLRDKAAVAVLLAAALMSFYWRPLFMVFSLLKEAGSYWYRYAYVAEAFMVIAAGHFLADFEKKGINRKAGFILAAVICIGLAVWMDRLQPHEDRRLFLFGIVSAVLIALLLSAISIYHHPALTGILLLAVIIELAVNGYCTARNYLREDARACADYNRDQIRLLKSITDDDPGVYRITQNMTRSMDYHWTTANLNESMGFHYMSVENYTSCPQNTQLDLMEKFGYGAYSDRILPKSTFLQPVDSLLGVKYLLSPYPVRETAETGTGETLNGKLAYRNDYALPPAFRIGAEASVSFRKDFLTEPDDPSGRKTETDLNGSDSAGDTAGDSFEEAPPHPFEYWNRVYAGLTGLDEPIMEELEYDREKTEKGRLYTIEVPDGDYAVYGNLPHRKDANAYIRLNGRFNIPYARWQAVKAFNIPSDPDQRKVTLEYMAKNTHRITDVQFYGLNLEIFRRDIDLLKKGSPSVLTVGKRSVSIVTDGRDGELLFTSFPWDRGWSVRINGREVEPLLFENCLISLPLTEGENHIEMRYHVPGLPAGLGLTVLAIVFLAAVRFIFPQTRH